MTELFPGCLTLEIADEDGKTRRIGASLSARGEKSLTTKEIKAKRRGREQWDAEEEEGGPAG